MVQKLDCSVFCGLKMNRAILDGLCLLSAVVMRLLQIVKSDFLILLLDLIEGISTGRKVQ